MGHTKDTFLVLREAELSNLYPSDFTKKNAIKAGKKFILDVVENGNVSIHQLMTNIARLKAVVDTAESELRQHLPFEKIQLNGVEFSPVDGGYTLDYAEDPIYCTLKKDLDDRVELLKLAQHQEVIDLYGNEVPKVGKTPRKSSITLKF